MGAPADRRTLPPCRANPFTPPSVSATSTSRSRTSTVHCGSTATGSGSASSTLGRRASRPPSWPPAPTTTTSASTRGRAPAARDRGEPAGGAPPPAGHTGLYHAALVYPDRRELGRAVQRLLDHGYEID